MKGTGVGETSPIVRNGAKSLELGDFLPVTPSSFCRFAAGVSKSSLMTKDVVVVRVVAPLKSAQLSLDSGATGSTWSWFPKLFCFGCSFPLQRVHQKFHATAKNDVWLQQIGELSDARRPDPCNINEASGSQRAGPFEQCVLCRVRILVEHTAETRWLECESDHVRI